MFLEGYPGALCERKNFLGLNLFMVWGNFFTGECPFELTRVRVRAPIQDTSRYVYYSGYDLSHRD